MCITIHKGAILKISLVVIFTVRGLLLRNKYIEYLRINIGIKYRKSMKLLNGGDGVEQYACLLKRKTKSRMY